MPALGQFPGSAAVLAAAAITLLTETWKAEQRAVAERDLSGVDCVYLRADGIHVNIRLEERQDAPCAPELAGRPGISHLAHRLTGPIGPAMLTGHLLRPGLRIWIRKDLLDTRTDLRLKRLGVRPG
jgi:hypothetical protein